MSLASKQFFGEGVDPSPDKVLRSYFDYDYVGVYVDVGAAGPQTISNSYHFRLNGWSIYSVEANPTFAALYREAGFNIVETVVGAMNKKEVDFTVFYIPNGVTTEEGGSGQHLKNHNEAVTTTRLKLPMRTLNDIFSKEWADVKTIDILDIDVEGNEFEVLKGLDLTRLPPKVILVEEHKLGKVGAWLKCFNYRLDQRHFWNSFYVRD